MADINTATFPSLYAGTKRLQDYDNDYLYYDSCLLHPRQGHQGTDGKDWGCGLERQGRRGDGMAQALCPQGRTCGRQAPAAVLLCDDG